MRHKKILNDYKLVRIMKWGLFHVFRLFIKLENTIYINFIPHIKKRRIFSTSGNISLINILAIVNEVGNFDMYEDILLINTGKGREDFLKNQLEIAKIHNFKRIIPVMSLDSAMELAFKNIFTADEIYLLNHPLTLNRTLLLYSEKVPVCIFDEGVSSLLNYNIEQIKNPVKIRTHKYIGKLDFFGLKEMDDYSFIPVNKNEFQKVSSQLSLQYPIIYDVKPEDKTILYCGIYWEVTGLSRNDFIKEQTKMLDSLLNKGYKILYKPHPRDNEFFGYDKNPDIQFISSKFPIELYKTDVLAIVSLSSSSVISYAHYWNIPCFSNILEKTLIKQKNDKVNISLIRNIIAEYSPNYKELLEPDVKNMSKEALKNYLKQRYDKIIEEKPLLSRNKRIKDICNNEY